MSRLQVGPEQLVHGAGDVLEGFHETAFPGAADLGGHALCPVGPAGAGVLGDRSRARLAEEAFGGRVEMNLCVVAHTQVRTQGVR